MNTTRVRLSGLVVSTPKLLGSQKFVVLNPDGKGLLVQGSSKQPSPARGSVIELTGTLSWNDSGLILKQGTQDTWHALSSSTESFPLRVLPLPAPALEDGWSHVELEGVVQEQKATSVVIETATGDVITVNLPKVLGYRAARVEKGDTLRVRGLYDPRQDWPTIIPQVLEDIEILARAPLPAAKTSLQAPANSQPWLPLGLVGGTLAVSEAWRRTQKLREKARERLLLRLGEPQSS